MARHYFTWTIVALLIATDANACLLPQFEEGDMFESIEFDSNPFINENGTSLTGARRQKTHSFVPQPKDIDRDYYRERIVTLTNSLDKSSNYQDASDLAVAHVYLGKIDRAIELLENAEKWHPGDYRIAANLGTAYELAGRNKDALIWIQKGIRRNKEAHNGSEWVHTNLLLAKIGMASDSDWLMRNSVTGLDFGHADLPSYSADDSTDNCPLDPSDVRANLEYQLLERRQFVPGPDPIVAALMFDLANATVITHTAEDALPIYQVARDLGFHDQQLLNRRISALEALRDGNVLSGWSQNSITYAVLCVVGFLVIAVVMVIRFIHRKKMTNHGMHAEPPNSPVSEG